MTEKRFTVRDKWIKDNCIGRLLNIDFNTITDANLCCDLLNRIEKEKRRYGKLASKLLDENEQLKSTKKKRLDRLQHQRETLFKQQEAIIGYKGDIKQLRKENEQLKQENKKLADALTAYFESKTKR